MKPTAAIVWLGVLLAACQTAEKDPELVACANDLYGEDCSEARRAQICGHRKADPSYNGSGITSADCDRYFGIDDGGADAGDAASIAADGGVGVDAQVADCEQNLDCPVSKPFCKAGACVPCANSAVCADRSDTPVCGASGACVACTASELGACAASGDVCRAGANECVECNGSAECSSPSASRCEGNACVQCREDADCGHLAGTKVCDAGQCVECTPAKEAIACPDADPAPGDQSRACDPAAKTCTGKVRGSVSGCGACASDSECEAGSRCLATDFGTSPHGSYCLQIAPSGLCPNGAPSKKVAASVLGTQGEYCFPVESLTTCEAIVGFKDACTRDADCGAVGSADGLCVGPEGAKVCTYACSGNRDCVGGQCTGPVGAKYCNPN